MSHQQGPPQGGTPGYKKPFMSLDIDWTNLAGANAIGDVTRPGDTGSI
jgi:hypothetical protein